MTSILAKPNVDDDGFEIVLSKSQMKKLKSKKKNIEDIYLSRGSSLSLTLSRKLKA